MSSKAARAHGRPQASKLGRVPASPTTGAARPPAEGAPLPVWVAGVPVAVALALYWPTLAYGFIWDDTLVLQQLRAIHSLNDLLVIPPSIPRFYFRPVVFGSYLLDRSLGGESPLWFHASVVVLHAVNTLLVFLLARGLFPAESLIAPGGALLFAVFPTHVESVAWMAGRSDVIVCVFMLITVLLFLERQRWWSPWLGAATFLLAALSKELALSCVLLVPLLDVLRTRRAQWKRWLPLSAATFVYFMLRKRAVGAFVGGAAPDASAAQLALDVVRAIGFYAVHATVPLRLCAYVPRVSAAGGYLWAGAVVLFLGAAALAAARRAGSWPLAFLLAWCFATLAPSLTVIARRSASALVADRYLYVPSVASCILTAYAITCIAARFARSRRAAVPWAAGAIGLLSVAFGVQAAGYSQVWAGDLTFWSDVAAKMPAEPLPHRELANALQARGKLDEAEHELQRALSASADAEERAMTYNNLGNLYRRLARYVDAERVFEEGIRIWPHPTLCHNLGMALMSHIEQEQRSGDQAAVIRDMTRARAAFERALQLGAAASASAGLPEWDAAKTHSLLGQVLFSLGDRAAARQHLEAALRLAPTGPVADLTRQYMQKMQL